MMIYFVVAINFSTPALAASMSIADRRAFTCKHATISRDFADHCQLNKCRWSYAASWHNPAEIHIVASAAFFASISGCVSLGFEAMFSETGVWMRMGVLCLF
jgi:hypothetical protein